MTLLRNNNGRKKRKDLWITKKVIKPISWQKKRKKKKRKPKED